MRVENSDTSKCLLELLDKILDNIGQVEDIISYEEIINIQDNIVGTCEKEMLDSLLLKLQSINDQMENMKWLNKSYRILHDFASLCSKTLDETTLLTQAYKMVSQVMPTDAFYISLYDASIEEVNFLMMIENNITYPNISLKLGDNYTSKVIRMREIVHLKKGADSQSSLNGTFGVNETKSCLFVPIIVDDQVRGVISAQSFRDFAYKKEHEELIQIIGAQVMNSISTARIYETTYRRSRMDEMTQLRNYRAFHEDLERLILDKSNFSIIMIDSDNLKSINDKYGHDFGDYYLIELAKGMQFFNNKKIKAYRYAGDEFMFLVKEESVTAATRIYDQLIAYYESNPIIKNEEQFCISISTGIAHFPTNGKTMEEIKKSVDNALYRAKHSGKNKVVYA